ncbi:MAG: hypothetical protein IJ318_01350 [Clostridia bacterium]|nr:hypothetical protein [Clostridia bacterium]
MKKSIWISISTLVLCLGVMAFGVYSALSATLNITGNLGFNIHDCVVGVSGTIYNLSEMDSNGTSARLYDKTLGSTIMGGEEETTSTIKLGDMYFYHGAYVNPETKVSTVKTYDIIFQITITNLSESKITANIPLPTLGDTSAVTIIHGATNANYTTLPYEAGIAKDSQITIMFALRLTDETALTEKLAFNWQNINFEEVESPFYVINDASDTYNGYLATKMGHGIESIDGTTADLEWFAFAVKGEDLSEEKNATSITVGDDTWYSLSDVNMNNVTYTGKTFWFIQRYVTAGGYSSSTGSWIDGQMFDGDEESNDYDQSDICAYLSATGAYITTSVTGIADSDLYAKITERSISETYTVEESSQDNTFSSRLWLLSKAELTLLGSQGSEPVKVCGIGNTVGHSGGGASWWLRSPDPYDAYYAYYVDFIGNLNGSTVGDFYGVCAAFEITIA